MTAMANRVTPIDGRLVCGGRFHDFDYVRLRLLEALSRYPEARVTVCDDYSNSDALTKSSFLISYTFDVRPSLEQQRDLRRWVEAGGRWLALHGTNTAIDKKEGQTTLTPNAFPKFVDTLGSRFLAHPPAMQYEIRPTTDHPFVQGLVPFVVEDELRLNAEHESVIPLLETTFLGTVEGFATTDWTAGDGRRTVMYLRPLGSGTVCYLTLGQAVGHYDLRPFVEWNPNVSRGAWEHPVFEELLRRTLEWCLGREPYAGALTAEKVASHKSNGSTGGRV
jgi:hypothetical protein